MRAVSLYSCVLALTVVSVTAEFVWLRDLTFDQNKRNLDGGLPDSLAFSITKGTQKFDLNLKQNRRLNANAPVYDMKINSDGKRELVKKTSQPLKVAFYQDKRNGGAFSVECEWAPAAPCVRKLSGSFRLHDKTFEIHPASDTITRTLSELSRALKGVPHVITEVAVKSSRDEYTDAVDVPEIYDRDQIEIPTLELTVPERYLNIKADVHSEDETLELIKKELRELVSELESESLAQKLKGRQSAAREKRQSAELYAIEIYVVCDPAVWDMFYERTSATSTMTHEEATEYALRQHYVHIINGISLRYEEIEDVEMDIYCTVTGFLFFKDINDETYPEELKVTVEYIDDKGYTDVTLQYVDYLTGVRNWTATLTGLPNNDHVMFFTGYELVAGSTDNTGVAGYAYVGAVCDMDFHYRVSVQEDDGESYFSVVAVAAHELGHNMGSQHDGSNSTYSLDCSADDTYVMAPSVANFGEGDVYSVNPWRFSDCSINAFKAFVATLDANGNNCLTNNGDIYDDEEYQNHTSLLPGQLHTADEQCKLIRGDDSDLCSKPEDEDFCSVMWCTDGVKTGTCWAYVAAMGTSCGLAADDTWCFEGLCVPKVDIFTGNTGNTDSDSEDGDDNEEEGTGSATTAATGSSDNDGTTSDAGSVSGDATTKDSGSVSVDATTPDTGSVSGDDTTPDTGSVSGDATTPDTGSVSGDATTPNTGSVSGDATTPDTGSVSGDATTPDTGSVSDDATTPDTGSVSGDSRPTDSGSVSGDATTPDTGSVSGDTTTTAVCVNEGWVYDVSYPALTCKQVAELFMEQWKYRPSLWCTDQTWYNRCCGLCSNVGTRRNGK